ncbi:hypothetical protein SAMN05421594_0626 [Chryseobacterium oleae]|uniref:Uncharacterized protein n=1 Tax=Chryseobacterium oleae TaxID=491207 RepID=A0A1I4VTX9_CHROL|nr:DUF6252 family protein [Chryseobacterium oleae]SFN04741.1 hypothetical protein SAMN05421594_0626 [Chryseobacterium oleae]
MKFNFNGFGKYFIFKTSYNQKAMKSFLLTISLIGILSSCKDKNSDTDPTLPQATQTGADTGGALVNGKIWVSKIEKSTVAALGNNTTYTFVNNEYSLKIHLRNAENPSGNTIQLLLVSNQDFAVGDYPLNENDHGLYYDSSKIYATDHENIGTLSITKFDKANKIISGTFSFKAKYYYDGDAVTITDGRFDRKYQ